MRKRWIYLTVAALAVGGMAAAAVAQRGGPAWAPAWAALDLTDAQKQQLEDLRAEHRAALQALWAGGERPDMEARAALWAEHREKLARILTEEQMATLGDRWARRPMGRRGGRWAMGRPGMDPGQPPGRGPVLGGPMAGQPARDALARLDLTDKQREALQKLRQKHREEMQELARRHRAALEKVLTDAQRAQLDRMKDDAFYGWGPWGGRP